MLFHPPLTSLATTFRNSHDILALQFSQLGRFLRLPDDCCFITNFSLCVSSFADIVFFLNHESFYLTLLDWANPKPSSDLTVDVVILYFWRTHKFAFGVLHYFPPRSTALCKQWTNVSQMYSQEALRSLRIRMSTFIHHRQSKIFLPHKNSFRNFCPSIPPACDSSGDLAYRPH